MVDRSVRDLARRIVQLEKAIRQQKMPQLGNSSFESGEAITGYADSGTPGLTVGTQYDQTYAAVTFAGPTPASPAGISVSNGPVSSMATWDGTFVDALVAPLDWTRCEFHAGIGEDFEVDPMPSSTTRLGSVESAAGGSITFTANSGDVWVKAITRTAAGKWSDASAAVQVNNPETPTDAAISKTGDGSFATVSSAGDITIAGMPLMGRLLDPNGPTVGLLEQRSGGILGAWDFKSLSTFGATITNGYLMMGQFEVFLAPGRAYQFNMPWRAALAVSGSPAPAQCSGALRAFATYTYDGTEPADPDFTVTSSLIADDSHRTPATASTGSSGILTALMATGDITGATVRAKIGIAAYADTGTAFVPSNFGSNAAWIATVLDIGANTPLLQAAEPGQSGAQKFITTWTANASKSWAQDGTAYVAGGGTGQFIRQGVASGGKQWFGAFSCGGGASSGDEAGKTVAQALSAGYTLLKAEVWVWCTWAAEDTPQVELRPLGGNSVPSSMSTPGAISNITKADFPSRNSGRWITVPTTWFSPSNNGCIIASPDWLFPNTDCQFAGAANSDLSWRPKIRLTYTR